MKPGWSPFPVRPVANESGLWTAHLHCGNHPEPSSPFSLPILSSLFLSNSCLRFVFQILFPILPLWSSQLILVSSVEPENSPRVFPHILPTAFPSPLCSPCSCSSPTQNTNADIIHLAASPDISIPGPSKQSVGHYKQRRRMEVHLEWNRDGLQTERYIHRRWEGVSHCMEQDGGISAQIHGGEK